MTSLHRIAGLPRFAGAALLSLALAAGSISPAPAGSDDAMMEKAAGALAFGSQDEAAPLEKGAAAPANLPLKTADGADTTLASTIGGKPAVVVFYRGGWCPYCNTHLADLAQIEGDLKSRGVEIVAITPDTPEELGKTKEKNKLSYALLSDADFKTMKAFGVGFMLDPETKAKYESFGVKASVLPVPSVFVLDAKGTVQFVHHDTDYKKRLSADDVLKAVDSTVAKQESAKAEMKKGALEEVGEALPMKPEAGAKPTSRPTKKR